MSLFASSFVLQAHDECWAFEWLVVVMEPSCALKLLSMDYFLDPNHGDDRLLGQAKYLPFSLEQRHLFCMETELKNLK